MPGTWLNGSLVIPISPEGQITLTREGECVHIQRRYYQRGPLGEHAPDRVTTFHVPFMAMATFVAEASAIRHESPAILACDNCGSWSIPNGPTKPSQAWCAECTTWTHHGTRVPFDQAMADWTRQNEAIPT